MWPALAFLAVFYVYPVAQMLLLSVTEPRRGLGNFVRILTMPLYLLVLRNTFEISFIVAGLCLLIGYPTAYFLLTGPKRLTSWLMILVLLPFFTSVLVRTYSWIFLLGWNGIINQALVQSGLATAPLPLLYNRLGVVIGMVHVLLPYMVLILYSVMRGIDLQLLSAAQGLAASPFTSFRRVFLPLSFPGIFSGFVVVLVMALAFFVTPAMLGSPHETMIANLVSHYVDVLQWGFASALGVVLLVCSLVALGVMQWLFGGLGIVTGTSGGKLRRSRVREGVLTQWLDRLLSPLWAAGPPVIGVAAVIFLFIPVTVMLPMSVSPLPYFSFPPAGISWRWYRIYLESPDWIEATRNSIEIGLITCALSMLLSIPASLAISRSTGYVATFFFGLLVSPMVMPAIIIAIAVSFLLGQMHLVGTAIGVALGQTVGALPLATVVLVAALRNFDRNLERAAWSLAANPVRATLRVVLPIIAPAVWTAGFFAFLYSFDELLVALFVGGVDARTLPKKMWESLQEVDPTIAAVSTILVAVTVAVLVAVRLVGVSTIRRAAQPRASLSSPLEATPGHGVT